MTRRAMSKSTLSPTEEDNTFCGVMREEYSERKLLLGMAFEATEQSKSLISDQRGLCPSWAARAVPGAGTSTRPKHLASLFHRHYSHAPMRRSNEQARVRFMTAATGWPLTAAGQQPTMSVIGFLGTETPDLFADRVRAFHQGLNKTGYVEGRNVAVEYRCAKARNERLPALAADLVRRQVT